MVHDGAASQPLNTTASGFDNGLVGPEAVDTRCATSPMLLVHALGLMCDALFLLLLPPLISKIGLIGLLD